MPTLKEILEANERYVLDSGFTVNADKSMQWVSIEGMEEGQEIFMQGDEASEYIEEAERLWNELGDVGQETCLYSLAKEYIDCLC